ncbi:acetyl-CoA carboxylase biotin carboxylase subunit [Niastella yeongjuensis]|uniref:Acetyl-CoA carboxylase biotin carboxylase subunit n=1 Tax=Niastella yeongjuensis TaxID=354355 RepID=A0A1V9ELQ0_9BACT|nr:acetyl-CoA carboxylase biotin carboxylase subunit [Niastella yeongjuensis]OQP46874.1 acetyl-CoA carboxylase biotin carboxylase subunit [Niastella yeongjuensis]SEN58211.1 propionyl-CoA carboxylase alpha chain [Niastella yeongjuensis]
MQKILVANRGEIALRIMRTIHSMGIKSVAVYSEADRHAPHVLFADEAVCLGPAPSSQSYLNGNAIIAFAKQLGVDGIHPGYGFLSENAGFAQQVEEAGITFIGPGYEAMRIMGSKLAAKECVKQYNIPMVPGIDKAIDNIAVAKKIAAEIGYPVLIKASAGGGGKGMRIAARESELEEQMERATSEALSSFGDGSVFIEKYVNSPRHIEIQVLADNYGNTVHLFERECSIQRRHQKVVEESPSSVLTPEIRQKMGEAAVMVAKSCNYRSTGTVEFLLDEQLNFYFLEMNTRLQVEHPVTEMITGIDLVEEQIKIARGDKLRFQQNELTINGHALELRVYAEDPLHEFLPSTGTLTKYRPPQGEGIRVDDGYREGMAIPVYYDPMIAKLITHGRNRTEAIQKMKAAIVNYTIEGVETTLPFGNFVFDHEAFLSGRFDTQFVQKYYTPEKLLALQKTKAELAALIALHYWLQKQKEVKAVESTPTNWTKRI